MDNKYYFRKNLISTCVLLFFAVIFIILSIRLGYYWNAIADSIPGWYGVPLIAVALFAPVVLLALLGSMPGRRPWMRALLALPALIYFFSAVVELGKITPFKEHLGDFDVLLNNIQYLPFIVPLCLFAFYLVFVIAIPGYLVTRVFGVIAMIAIIIGYGLNAIVIIYEQLMAVLGSTFGMGRFILNLGCMGLDIAIFFIMLSIIMSYCALQREIRQGLIDSGLDDEIRIDDDEDGAEEDEAPVRVKDRAPDRRGKEQDHAKGDRQGGRDRSKEFRATASAGDVLDKPRATVSAGDVPDKPRATASAGDVPDKPRAAASTGDVPDKSRASASAGDVPDKSRASASAGDVPDKPRATASAGDVPDKSRASASAGDVPDKSRASASAGDVLDKPRVAASESDGRDASIDKSNVSMGKDDAPRSNTKIFPPGSSPGTSAGAGSEANASPTPRTSSVTGTETPEDKKMEPSSGADAGARTNAGAGTKAEAGAVAARRRNRSRMSKKPIGRTNGNKPGGGIDKP